MTMPAKPVRERGTFGPQQAADLLGVSVATIRRWCDAALIPHWRTPNGQRRFDRAELEAWLEKRSTGRDPEVNG